MIDLIVQMALCLIIALILGFIIGWVLSKISIKQKYNKEITQLKKNLLKSEDAVEKLKVINFAQEDKIDKIMTQNKAFREALEKNSQALLKTEKKLTLSKESLLQKNIKLEKLLVQNEKEIKGLERVLIKAEEIIDERNRKISLLEKKSTNKEDEELLITKDQFSYIEAQLIEYQKEIIQLKELNKRYKAYLSQNKGNQKREENLELDSSVFGDTYKKIIKS